MAVAAVGRLLEHGTWTPAQTYTFVMVKQPFGEHEASSGIRRYCGEYLSHAHNHAQVMFALQGRMELEIDGRCAFADSSCGVIIPAGTVHGFLAALDVRMFVMDLPANVAGDRVQKFAVTASCRASVGLKDVALQIVQLLQTPMVHVRRGFDLAQLDAVLDQALHESWDAARMARVFLLSPQRFHARLVELTGLPPQSYLRSRRLDRAAQLLFHGVPLETTALQVGYGSASALGFALKRDRRIGARTLRKS